jgi:hypothetical protein
MPNLFLHARFDYGNITHTISGLTIQSLKFRLFPLL